MVRGLEKFKSHFKQYSDRYILIGGTACYLAMEQVGQEFRRTRDLDIVLCVEALDSEFLTAFWDFIKEGNYENQQKSTGEKLFYRFTAPKDESFPEMLELFSKVPDALTFEGEGHLTPIPSDEEISSLSAILLDENYYEFLQMGKLQVEQLTFLGAEYLIPFKAKAWLDLTQRRESEGNVDSRSIRKHRNDILRLFAIVSPDNIIKLPASIKKDLRDFLSELEREVDNSFDLGPFGLGKMKVSQLVSELKAFYGIES